MAARWDQTWITMNQQYLSAALSAVRLQLEEHIARVTGHEISRDSVTQLTAVRQRCADISASLSPAPSLETLCASFGLSPFERDILLFCAGMELDGSFASAAALAHGDPQRSFPTFGLALAALPNPHWTALLPTSSLRYWRLIEFGQPVGFAGAPVTTRPI